jgi:hypothetical protein
MPVRRLSSRVKTARSLGFDGFVSPATDKSSPENPPQEPEDRLSGVKDLKSAIKTLFGSQTVKPSV